MSNVTLTHPHIAKLVVWYLLAQSEITDLVDKRIYTDLPGDRTYPLVRVTQLPGRSGEHRFAGTTIVQIDAYGPGVGDRDAAHHLAELCAAALARLTDRASYGGVDAVVTSVEAGLPGNDTDETFKPPKPYSRFDAVITATPVP